MARRLTLSTLLGHEAASGILLMLAAAAAMVIANSPAAPGYDAFLSARLAVTLNGQGLAKPLILWINDGLMAVFFLLVGLELKREALEGRLSNPRNLALPGLAALGGMAVPALVFVGLNLGSPANLSGWAIPAATDIAFALGVLALAGPRVPASLKLFLLTLAILDDLGAIIIIALFYSANLQPDFLIAALAPLAVLTFLNRTGVARLGPYVIAGAVLWVLVLKSGVHATLAGVITALFIPMRDRRGQSPLHEMEHGLQPYVNLLIVPLFAFGNAGVVLIEMTPAHLLAPLPLGIAAGLYLGKMAGVFGMTWLVVRSGLAPMPEGAGWAQVWGIACLAGIGFTMSLFIGSLSFDDPGLMNQVRAGVLTGSILSGITGFLVLRRAGRRPAQA